jgi:hypothetical protein
MKPIHTRQPHFHWNHFNIIFPSSPRSSEWSLTSGFPTKILHVFLMFPMRATLVKSTHYEATHYILSYSLLSLHHSSLRIFSASCSQPPPLCSSFNVRNQVPQPYKTFFSFLHSRRKTKMLYDLCGSKHSSNLVCS